jgi:hypothetical protein
MHHVFTINDQMNQCPYCTKDLNNVKWHSHFESIRMYKSFHCDCGKVVSMAVNFLGSGHDNWDKKESWKNSPEISFHKPTGIVRPLEARIQLIKEIPTK